MHKRFKPVPLKTPRRTGPRNEQGVFIPIPLEVTPDPIIKHSIQALALLKRQDNRCYWCCQSMSITHCNISHILSRLQGGSNTNSNLSVVCNRCKNRKRNHTPISYALDLLGANTACHYRRSPMAFGWTTKPLRNYSDNPHN